MSASPSSRIRAPIRAPIRARAGVRAGVRVRLYGGLAALGRILCSWSQRSRQRRELAQLEPWMLRDVGLTDHDVRREVRKPFWRP